jgi:hypothetical protein
VVRKGGEAAGNAAKSGRSALRKGAGAASSGVGRLRTFRRHPGADAEDDAGSGI